MSMKWTNTTYSDTETWTLLDSMDQRIAEVFKVEEGEWHLNVLDVLYDVKTSKEGAMSEVFYQLGIRPVV